MNEKELDKYLHTNYVGYIKNDMGHYCAYLKLHELNNFIQYAGLYGDLEIMRMNDGEVLLDTIGCFVNRIWPSKSRIDQTQEFTENINSIATRLMELREQDTYEGMIPKVRRYLDEISMVQMQTTSFSMELQT